MIIILLLWAIWTLSAYINVEELSKEEYRENGWLLPVLCLLPIVNTILVLKFLLDGRIRLSGWYKEIKKVSKINQILKDIWKKKD